MIISRLPILLLFLSFATLMFGQKRQDKLAAREAYDVASVALTQNNFKKAAKYFRNATKYDTSFIGAYRLLGMSEDLENNYVEALSAYETVLKADTTFSRLIYYQMGQLYYKLNRPDVSLYYLRKFKELQEKELYEFGIQGERERENELEALDDLPTVIAAVRITRDSAEFINMTEIYNLGRPINSARSDYFPFYSNDGRSLLFTRQNESKDEDLIRARRRNVNDEWVINRVGSVNTNKPEGMVTLVRDGERVFFTQCRTEETEENNCDLYSGLLINDKIESVEKLADYVNSETWESQAGISCDGRKLFFASTRPGGVGSSDLYYCEMLYNGEWSKPKNLGYPVNTPGIEEAPFLSNDGKTLYFSSTGHPGLGDEDIFMSWWNEEKKRWGRPINLGPPVNSPHRELGFHLSSDNKSGYFASDRPGGFGELDIYGFQLSKRLSSEPITYVSGFVLDSITGEPFPNIDVPVNGGPRLQTNYAGRFFICAGADEVIQLTTQPAGYRRYENSFAIPEWENTYPYRIDLLLQKDGVPPPPPPLPSVPEPDTVRKRVTLLKRNHTVRFNFDESVIIPRQRESINLFLRNLGEGKIQEVSITGYTDDNGEGEYNQKLSEERADIVAAFLQATGIGADRVSVRGAGMLIGGRRELNRRVEIQVVMIREY